MRWIGMYGKDDWGSMGWSTAGTAFGGFTAGRNSSVVCECCNMSGLWNMRILQNDKDISSGLSGELSRISFPLV